MNTAHTPGIKILDDASTVHALALSDEDHMCGIQGQGRDTPPTRSTCRNILFVLPPFEDDSNRSVTSHMVAMARTLSRLAYVYVARHDQSEWEDDEFGVRYVSFNRDHLPCFGALEAVFVLADRSLGLTIAAEHPHAEVFLLEPRSEMKRAA